MKKHIRNKKIILEIKHRPKLTMNQKMKEPNYKTFTNQQLVQQTTAKDIFEIMQKFDSNKTMILSFAISEQK